MNIAALHGNWVDLVILVVVVIYVLDGANRGFWSQVASLASFIGSLFLALRFYPTAAQLLIDNFTILSSFAKALGFILVVIVSETILGIVFGRLLSKVPKEWWNFSWMKTLSIVPSILDSGIVISIVLTALVALPVSPIIKADVSHSRIGGFLVQKTQGVERTLNEIFGGAIQDTLNFITIKPESRENIPLNFKPTKFKVDEVSEQKMLEMVNAERAKVGAKPLKVDLTIVVVARAHSQDMWKRSYFSHINPDGKDPFDRMREGGVEFNYAGENIALAPTVELAHNGLMNSEGHRRNILDPNFGRVGIGVIDGGVYGKMFTQNFAD